MIKALIIWLLRKWVRRYVMKRMIIGALKSKTMLFAGVLSILTWLQKNTAVVDALVPSTWQESAGYAIALSVAVLRVVTNKPLADK